MSALLNFLKTSPARFPFLTFFLLVVFPALLYGAYPVANIPGSLVADANRIYRVNNMEVNINGPGSFKVITEVVITIINENGKGPDVLAINYDAHISAKFIEGAIYDASGKEIKKIRRRDLLDTSNFQDFSLFEDNRVLLYRPQVAVYPYTVRYKYEQDHTRGLYYSGRFRPIPHYNSSTEEASLTITHPASLDVIFRTHLVDSVNAFSTQQTVGENVTLVKQWHFTQKPAILPEHLSPGFDRAAPWIMFATSRFEFGGYEGSNSSWNEFGKWVQTLNKGRDQLPTQRVEQLREMVVNLPTDREKVKAVYTFMQSRTRYVNVALGIGGMQPVDAQTVDRVGYGDCKALSNYMKAMLKAIGIESHYTLVRAGVGDYNILEDFTVFQFNHAILCVPLKNDTIWLECTSQTSPFGHLGDFTDNRPVLLICENGGYLTRTPAYPQEQNLVKTRGEVLIDNQGNGKANLQFSAGGIYFTDIDHTARMSPEDQKKWIYQNYPFPNYTLENHSIMAIASDEPVVEIKLDLALRSLANITGQRLFVPLNAISSGWEVPPRERNSTQPLSLKFSAVYCDTLYFSLPNGYKPESTLQPVEIKSEFGRFSVSYTFENNTLLFVRRLETYTGLFEPEKYQDYFRFFQSIARINNQSVAFVK
jgi:hypothetical protein